jgi:hypothetical protein
VSDDERRRCIEDNAAAAAEQIYRARDQPDRVRAVLYYWFEIMFDEGQSRAPHLRETVSRLRRMNERLARRLTDSGLPEPLEDEP